MTASLLRLIFIAVFWMYAGIVAATPMVTVEQCINSTDVCATGITGLPLANETYNVTFVWDSFEAAFGAADPLFLDDGDAAFAAAELLVDVLNQFPGIVGIVAQPSDRLPFSTAAVIPIQLRLTDIIGYAARTHEVLLTPFQLSFGPTELHKSDLLQGSFNTWAVFEPTADTVPEPGSMALLMLGLLSIGTLRVRGTTSSARTRQASIL